VGLDGERQGPPHAGPIQRPINAEGQAVLFYLYAPDVAAYRAELMEGGVRVGLLTYPTYMPEGEFRVHDPDGYVLLVGQSDDASL